MSLISRARLPIASPCPERFDDMQKTGSRAYCDRCEKSVHDLSSMTRAQAGGFLAQHRGQRVCVRYQAKEDGAIRFRSPVPTARMGGILAIAGLMAACAGHSDRSIHVPDGEICEDVSGYVIPCEDAVALGQATTEPTRPPQTTPDPTIPDPTIPDPTVPDPFGTPQVEPSAEPVVAFPDPTNYEGLDDHPDMMMGDIAPDFTDREIRQMQREADRENKRLTFRERQARRRRARG